MKNWQRRHYYYYINLQWLNQKVACECLVYVNNLSMLYWLSFMFRYYSFLMIFIFSRLCITAFRLFSLIFNISDCLTDCYPVGCAPPRMWLEGCVSWNNMMLISNRKQPSTFLDMQWCFESYALWWCMPCHYTILILIFRLGNLLAASLLFDRMFVHKCLKTGQVQL